MLMIKEQVVKRFKSICESRGITYNHLANISGVTPSTVYSLMDSRRKEVTINLIKILCDGLDMSLKDFFDSEEFEEIEQEIK